MRPKKKNQAKLISGRTVIALAGGKGWIGNRQKETFCSDENVLYVDGGVYIIVYT